MTKHLISPLDFSLSDLNALFTLGTNIMAQPAQYADCCRGKKLASLFFEPSTRTRLSFEAAMLELGGQVLSVSSIGSSSAVKGESLADTMRMISCYADIASMRHPFEGAAAWGSLFSSIPLINAGDGGHLHPTQTLTDLFSIHRKKGTLNGLCIALCGDLKYGRTVHSLIRAMLRYQGTRFLLIHPRTLGLPSYIIAEMTAAGCSFESVSTLQDALTHADVLYMTRIQRERFTDAHDLSEDTAAYTLTATHMKHASQKLLVLHPLPRVDEIHTDVDADPRAYYFQQALCGKYIRMALIATLLKNSKADCVLTAPCFPHSDNTARRCTNPRCITQHERGIHPAAVPSSGVLRCLYCEHTLS